MNEAKRILSGHDVGLFSNFCGKINQFLQAKNLGNKPVFMAYFSCTFKKYFYAIESRIHLKDNTENEKWRH